MKTLEQLILVAMDAHDPIDMAFQMSPDEAERVVNAVLHTLALVNEPTKDTIDAILKREI